MEGGPMGILLMVVSIFVIFILLMAFSEPISMIFSQMKDLGEMTDTGKTGPNTPLNQTASWETYGNTIYSILFGVTMIGGAVMLFLGVVVKRRRQTFESERYGGDYGY